MAHPHIVQFRELFLIQSHLAIVMEYAGGGDMFDFVIKNKGPGAPLLTARGAHNLTAHTHLAMTKGSASFS